MHPPKTSDKIDLDLRVCMWGGEGEGGGLNRVSPVPGIMGQGRHSHHEEDRKQWPPAELGRLRLRGLESARAHT